MEYSVIKEGDLFFLTEKNGDILKKDSNGYGLYTKDTRYLSHMEFFIDGEKPTLLSSEATKSYLATFHLMKDKKDVGAIELVRNRFIYEGVLYEKVSLINYFPSDQKVELSVFFDADFQDMFIVRNFRSGKVGKKLATTYGNQTKVIAYRGADDIERRTSIHWDTPESEIKNDGEVVFSFSLKQKETKNIIFKIVPKHSDQDIKVYPYENALEKLEDSYIEWMNKTTKVKSDMELFDNLYNRGLQDLRMLMTDIGYGDVPVAGLPWYAVPFGRDSLITSLFMLPLSPELVKGTLRTLAVYQGKKIDPWRDEQPGKIMHEIRFGELSMTNQSPFTPYYGTNDATPLFLVLIGEYFNWTGDISLIKELMPNIKKALEWIENYGDRNNSGFVSYHQEAEKGFPNQGWKDSSNSMVHENGDYATSPIALVEVQGYVYQAKSLLAPIIKLVGEDELAEKLEKEADQLRALVEDAYWIDTESYYAVALDEGKRQVKSITSNPGHLLMTNLPSKERARNVAKRLLEKDMFNGYGIRTMSKEATGYYPMSYHNGSVWPHDNAMILMGLNKLGFKEESRKVISGLLEASKFFEYQRLPELFCGHDGDIGHPVLYPTTCSPQAWSATASIVFIQTMLGLNPKAIIKQVKIDPSLPTEMDYLEVDNISIGTGKISLVVKRIDSSSTNYQIDIKENTSDFEIILNQ